MSTDGTQGFDEDSGVVVSADAGTVASADPGGALDEADEELAEEQIESEELEEDRELGADG